MRIQIIGWLIEKKMWLAVGQRTYLPKSVCLRVEPIDPSRLIFVFWKNVLSIERYMQERTFSTQPFFSPKQYISNLNSIIQAWWNI